MTSARAQPPPLFRDGAAEMPQVGKIAFEKSPRLLGHPINPFHARFPHPHRRAPAMPRQKINCAADPDANWHAEPLIMHVDPLFLLRTTESNKQQIWFSRLDARNDVLVIHFDERL